MSYHNPATEVKQLSRGGARQNLGSLESLNFQPLSEGHLTMPSSNMTQVQTHSSSKDSLHSSSKSNSENSIQNMISQVSQLVSSRNEKSISLGPDKSSKHLSAQQSNCPQISSQESPLSSGQRPEVVKSETVQPTPTHVLENAQQNQVQSQPDSPNIWSATDTQTLNMVPDDPMIQRIATSNGFYIKASIEGVNMTLTIDTGATKTVISERVYNAIPKSQKPKLKPTNGLTDATGQPLPQLGTAVFKIRLAPDLHFESDIIVANIEDEGLLGHDLLTYGKAHLLYDEAVLQFMGMKIPCMKVGTSPRVRQIFAADHFIIPGYSEKVIDVYVERSKRDDHSNGTILLEPSLAFMERYSLIMAASLSDLNSRVTHKVRILNPNQYDIHINQDVNLGTAENVSEIVSLIQEESSSHGNLNQVPPNHNIQDPEINNNETSHHVSPNEGDQCNEAQKPQIHVRRIDEIDMPEHLKELYQAAIVGRTELEKTHIAQTLLTFQNTFSKHEFDLGLTTLIEHTIDVGNHGPIKQAPRRVPAAFASEEENVIKQLENQGVIRKSTSPWASPICLVRKRSGKIRPCVDYRRLNEITVKDAFPLPRISDCLDAVAGAQYFSTFDMTSGFHQVKIKESDIPKTAFCTKYGLYEYLTMPMGLSNSPAVFQRLMEFVLSSYQWHICLIYLDDVLVFGSNFDEHMDRVDQVLDRITQAGLKLRPEKCWLLQSSVNFLGHTISSEGVLPNPDNLAKIQQWPVPTTQTEVRQILGLGSYYRRFIKNYSDLVRPMTLLTHKNTPFVWSEACMKAFETLKQKLMGSEIMAYPRNEGQYILDTDASDTQISGILSQVQDGRERVISYGSRSLNKAERNYCITDKELLAIRHFVEYYRQYLLGRRFLVRSDHNALVFLFRMKEPKGRIARWIEILSAFDMSIEYRKSQRHGNADSLTRCPDPWDCQCAEPDNLESLKCGPCAKCTKRFKEMQGLKLRDGEWESLNENSQNSIRAVNTRSSSDANSDPGTSTTTDQKCLANQWLTEKDLLRVQKLQEKDPDLSPIISALKTGQRPPHSDIVSKSPAVRYYWSIWNSLSLQNGCLYREFYRQDGTGSHLQFLVPKSIRSEILAQMHNSVISGHFGRKKTIEKLLQRFYWYNVREDVHMWLLKCDICASTKSPYRAPRAPMGRMQVGEPLDRLSVDFLGPLPVTPRNNRYILLATDHFSKWVEIMAVPDQTAKTCANKLLNEVVARYGCPLTILSDQGGAFESAVFHELCRLLEIKKTRTSPRNPRCNGLAERFNRSLLRMIKAYLQGEQTDWDLNLGCLASAYRASPSESTHLTPNLLFLGREVRLPAELMYGGQSTASNEYHSYGEYVEHLKVRMQHAHEVARKHLHTSAKRQAAIYDSKLSVYHYKVGDLVWVALEGCRPGLSPKLQASFRGPCIVVHRYNDLDYKVRLSPFGLDCVLHHNKLKPYEGNNIPRWIRVVQTRIAATKKKTVD